MPQITTAIPDANYVRVLNRIGAILLDELTNQKSLQPGNLPEDINVWKERLTPFDAAEIVSINIHVASATYGTMTQQDAMGRTVFYIDTDTSGKEVANTPAGLDSAQRLHRYMGVIAYIFRTPYYRNMQLPGVVGGTYVEQFETLDPNRKEDSDYTSFGRIMLAVRILESTETTQGVPLEINNTTVKLDLTEKGYKFVFNN